MKNVNKIDYHRTRSFPPLRPRIQDTRQNGLQFSIISDAPWLLTKYGNSKGGLLIFYFRQSMRIGTTPRDGSNCVKHCTIHQFRNRSTIRSEDHEKKRNWMISNTVLNFCFIVISLGQRCSKIM